MLNPNQIQNGEFALRKYVNEDVEVTFGRCIAANLRAKHIQMGYALCLQRGFYHFKNRNYLFFSHLFHIIGYLPDFH